MSDLKLGQFSVLENLDRAGRGRGMQEGVSEETLSMKTLALLGTLQTTRNNNPSIFLKGIFSVKSEDSSVKECLWLQ